MRGLAFSLSDSSVLKICIPPTFRNGRIDIAIRIIPIPPSHCRRARHSRIPFGASSRPVITVEPVVVIPDIDSKKESVKLICSSDKRNGKAPNVAIPNQLKIMSKKACLLEILFVFPILLRIKAPPKKDVIIMLKKKAFQSVDPVYKSASIGKTILIDKMERNIPIIYNIGLKSKEEFPFFMLKSRSALI